MREMLFRGKSKATGEWYYGNLNVNVKCICIITPDDTPIGKYGQVIPETVGQYIGLTDKNGKKIFEGDIVKVLYADNGYVETETTSVKYDSKTASYSPFNWEYSCDGCDCSTRIETVEVIGNIHDNPELLKGGE